MLPIKNVSVFHFISTKLLTCHVNVSVSYRNSKRSKTGIFFMNYPFNLILSVLASLVFSSTGCKRESLCDGTLCFIRPSAHLLHNFNTIEVNPVERQSRIHGRMQPKIAGGGGPSEVQKGTLLMMIIWHQKKGTFFHDYWGGAAAPPHPPS